MSIDVRINGAEARVAEAASIIDIVRAQGLDPRARGIAVALNESILPNARWEATRVAAGDRIEIVKAFAGG
jgi:sulfur carrier protein